MNKIVLSTLTALALSTTAASALTLYTNDSGQVFTTAGEGRTKLGDFVEAKTVEKTVKKQNETIAKIEKNSKATPLFSKSSKIKFSGLTYLGYTYNDLNTNLANGTLNTNKDTSNFEIRRAYFQVKAYLLDDPKSYYRVTFDISKDVTGDEKVRAKYAYLYLNNIFASTGVELGLAHRPWHDYEEHNSWYYRNISKVLIEDKTHGPDLSNSADFGVMFKTRTQYFDADYGIFNGEGYHSPSNGNGMSFEWRTTAHLMGVDGKEKQTKKTYWDASFFGQYNQGHKTVTVGAITENQDLIFGGLHTVFNTPSYLLSAQYVKSQNTSNIANNKSAQSGKGYSANAEYRMGAEKQYRVLARYDSWTPDLIPAGATSTKEDMGYILGAAWEQNRNVQWVGNVIVTDNEAGSAKEKNNGTAYMVTAEVKF